MSYFRNGVKTLYPFSTCLSLILFEFPYSCNKIDNQRGLFQTDCSNSP